MFSHNTRCLLPLSGALGGSLSRDYSPYSRPELVRGGPSIDDNHPHGYPAAGRFGQGDSIEFDAPDLDLAGTWAVDGWVYMPAASASGDYNGLVSFMTYGSNDNRLQIYVARNTFRMWSDTTSHLLDYDQIPFNAYSDKWTHFAIQRNSDTSIDVFLDGVLVRHESSSQTPAFTRKILINYMRAGSTHRYSDDEWLQDIRVTTGATLWPAAGFTPPVRLIGKLAGTAEDSAGNPAERTIRSYCRDSGFLFAETQSTNGQFEIPAYAPEPAYCVALENPGENALIFDHLEPAAP